MSNPSELPLCVDLDGTLIFTDALVESAVRSFFRAPSATLGALASLRNGRAAFKAQMLLNGAIDVESLPFNVPLIDRLRRERTRGRRLVLVTAANERVAHAVQAHLQLFDEVYASSEAHNLKGPAKSQFLVERYGRGGFVYVGDSVADAAVWRTAASAWTVGETGVRTARHAGVDVAAQFDGARSTARDWLKALGAGQWFWNLLLFLPLLWLPAARSSTVLMVLPGGVVCWCLAASGLALFSAMAGLEALGRQRMNDDHPVSAGRISLLRAGLAGFGLVAFAQLAALCLSLPLGGALALFIASSAMFAMRPSAAQSAAAALRCAWLIGLRVLAGVSVAADGLPFPVWVALWAIVAVLAMVGRWPGGRAA